MYSLTLVSSNRKTGPIPVSMSDSSTCPDSCSFKKGGCYGLGGPVLIHWRRLNEGLKGVLWKEFCDSVKKKIHQGQLWRYNQVGDVIGENETIDSESLKLLVTANKGKKGFGYSHKEVLQSKTVSRKVVKNNKDAIKHANDNGLTINLSADSIEQADKKYALKIAPVVVVLPSDTTEKTLFTPKGNKIVVCPATYRDEVTCASCGLCQKQRTCIVGFPAHGNAKKKVDGIISKL